MSLYGFLTLFVAGVLGVLFLFCKGRRILSRYLPAIFVFIVITAFSFDGYLTFKQYEMWLADPLAKFFLPPYQDFGYFTYYAVSSFFVPHLASLFTALVVLTATLSLNRRAGGIFFEKEEPYLAALSFFLVGYPGWLVYLAALISIYLIFHASCLMLQSQTVRLPLYHLWVPTSFFVIILNEYWISHTHWWALLNF